MTKEGYYVEEINEKVAVEFVEKLLKEYKNRCCKFCSDRITCSLSDEEIIRCLIDKVWWADKFIKDFIEKIQELVGPF
jgi:hypothetical protein